MNDPSSRGTLDLQPVAVGTWTAFTRNAIPFVVASAVIVLGVTLSLTLLTGPLMVGLIHMASRALAGESVSVSDLSEGFNKIGKPIITWLVILIAVAVGLLLLVLPGVALSILWLYSFWFVSRKDQLPSDALRSSWRLVQSNFPSTILLALMLVVLNVVGSFLVVGIFVALPMSVLLVTASFEQLTYTEPAPSDDAESAPEPTSESQETDGQPDTDEPDPSDAPSESDEENIER